MTTTRVLPAGQPDALAEAVATLRRGGLVAFPTDTVYGVGACAARLPAVRRVYEAKIRPADKALPLLLADASDLARWAVRLPASVSRLTAAFWPGPLTLVVWRSAAVPDEVTAGGPSVAVRLPDHEVPRALARGLQAPFAATSANLSGRLEAVSAAEVLAQLDGRIDLLLDGGPCPGGVASTVFDLTASPPAILRRGPLDARALQRLLDGA